MKNRASVLVRLDASRCSAVVEVKGAVTVENCQGILPVVERTLSLSGMGGVEVDLSCASVVESAARSLLRNAGCTVFDGPAASANPGPDAFDHRGDLASTAAMGS
ncbi:hypothetical protein [Arthrobacter sp. JSM 101049]|uniref:hypothetical protein n=1 Tax=Arthrobacter sp. JSM 101049 TaxID=929097 RepID=UPI0035613A46